MLNTFRPIALNTKRARSYLDLTNGKIEEGHAVTDFDGRLRADTAHGGAETSVELEDGQLVEIRAGFDLGDAIVGDNLILWGRIDLVPVDLCAFAPLCQPAVE